MLPFALVRAAIIGHNGHYGQSSVTKAHANVMLMPDWS